MEKASQGYTHTLISPVAYTGKWTYGFKILGVLLNPACENKT